MAIGDDQTIKQMKLYTQMERVERALSARGLSNGPLQAAQLHDLDQLHYGGTDAVDHAIEALELTGDDTVLDVGAGLGGPARHIAKRLGARVHAVELQPDLNQLAQALTKRCQLDGCVEHRCGDVLALPLTADHHDAVVSWLTVLHIPHRAELFARLHATLKPSGQLYLEDFYARQPLDEATQKTLANEVFCPHLPDRSRYVMDLSEAGFENVVFEDMSTAWTEFVAQRLAAFEDQKAAFIAEQDQATFDALHHFYTVMVGLFKGGQLGGVRIQAAAAR